MNNTYFILSRQIFESAIWRDNPHILKLFIYLIGNARHSKEPKKYPNVIINRGELVKSLSQISEENEYVSSGTIKNWSRQKVSRMLSVLEKQEYINKISDTYGTHIKVCNYDLYQSPDTYKSDTCGTLADSDGTLVEHLRTEVAINNNDKNVNNDKNENNDNKRKEIYKEKFSEFWDKYDYKLSKPDCIEYWEGKKKLKNGKRMNENMRESCLSVIGRYVENTYKNGNYPSRKHPKTYLYNSSWDDEIVEIVDKEPAGTVEERMAEGRRLYENGNNTKTN